MSAISDIKLRPGQVVVDAWDLVVDSPDRRSNTTPQRRALVHDYDDGLTINWAEDYPGGVTIQGELKADKGQGRLGRLGRGADGVPALQPAYRRDHRPLRGRRSRTREK